MATHGEWIHLTEAQLAADPVLAEAITPFRAPSGSAGQAAAAWLKEGALSEMEHIATYVYLLDEEIAAFYSLGMSEVHLQTRQRKRLGAHPRQGAVLILWLARAETSDIDADTILTHAVGIAQIGARHVGAAVVAVDPYDASAATFWRERYGFRSSSTTVRTAGGDELRRLWKPLFPKD